MNSYKFAVLFVFVCTSPGWGQLAPVVTPEEVVKQHQLAPAEEASRQSTPGAASDQAPRGLLHRKGWPTLRLANQTVRQDPAPPPTTPSQTPSVPSVPPGTAPPSALDSAGSLPTTTNPTLNPNRRTNPFASLAGRRGGRLFRTPHMFGDFTNQNAVVNVFFGFGNADVPLAGGARRMKVGEQNRALPQDRVYFFYNHFRNAIDTEANSVRNSASADRYTVGLEKAFNNNLWSVDIRFPLTSRFESNDPVMPITGGEIGNMQVIMKQRLSCSRTLVTSAGLGFDVPTGSGVLIEAPFADQRLAMANDALTIQPFVAFQAAPNDLFFANGFLQVDVPVNGNRITVEATQTNDRFSKVLDEAVLMHLDLSGGIWLYESTMPTGFTGLAAVAEFHYATGLSEPPSVAFNQLNATSQFKSTDARTDVANVTLGLHAALGRNSALRIGGAFPLSRDKRVFSSELQASLIVGY